MQTTEKNYNGYGYHQQEMKVLQETSIHICHFKKGEERKKKEEGRREKGCYIFLSHLCLTFLETLVPCPFSHHVQEIVQNVSSAFLQLVKLKVKFLGILLQTSGQITVPSYAIFLYSEENYKFTYSGHLLEYFKFLELSRRDIKPNFRMGKDILIRNQQ